MADFSSPAENTPQGRSVQKRKRIPIACNACRSRKSRVSVAERDMELSWNKLSE